MAWVVGWFGLPSLRIHLSPPLVAQLQVFWSSKQLDECSSGVPRTTPQHPFSIILPAFPSCSSFSSPPICPLHHNIPTTLGVLSALVNSQVLTKGIRPLPYPDSDHRYPSILPPLAQLLACYELMPIFLPLPLAPFLPRSLSTPNLTVSRLVATTATALFCFNHLTSTFSLLHSLPSPPILIIQPSIDLIHHV